MVLMRLGLLALAVCSLSWAENELNVGGFLNQVQQKHLGYQGSMLSAEGARQRSTEAATLLSFTLFANGEYVLDESPKIQVLQGTKNEIQNYSLGVSKLTSFGLAGKLYYNLSRTLITGLTPLPLPGFTIPDNYYDAKPALELTYSILRNGSGRETQATIEALEAKALSDAYADRFRAQVIESEAEVAYWRLALARDALSVQQDSVERSRKIRDWNQRRVRMRLADESDLLQAESGLRLRELELQQVVDEERVAAQAFNSLRGLDKSTVEEALTSLEDVDISQLPLPPKADRRQDVEAAFQGQKAALASARVSVEKNSPNLELYSMLSLAGRDASVGDVVADSFHTTYPVVAVGARFSVPLDFSVLADTRKGYEKEAKGAELKYQRKIFEQDTDWDDFNRKYGEAKKRLDLALEIEKVQREKFLHEKERQTVGRSTTFLVLQFEQDLASSQFSRLRLQAELLMLVAQMKIFSPVAEANAGGAQ